MPNTDTVKTVSNYALKTQSILDVFVVQGLVSPDDAEKLKKQYRTNDSLERALLKNHIASRETINKAYSILLKLPFVSLKNLMIGKETLNTIPEKIAKRYGVIAFDLPGNSVKIAVSRPSELSADLPLVLERLFEKKEISIDLYVTGDGDFREAYAQYRKPSENKLIKSGYPVVFLRNQSINSDALSRLPLDFMKKNRMAVFKKRAEDSYDIASEKPDDPNIIRIIRSIEENNKIKFQIFAASREDIDYLIDIHPSNENPADKLAGQPQVAKDDEVEEERKDEPKKIEQTKDDEIVTLGGLFSSFSGANSKGKEPTITIEKKESDNIGTQENVKDKNQVQNNTVDEKENVDEQNVEINEADIQTSSEDRENTRVESNAKDKGIKKQDDEDIGSLLNEEIDDKEDLIKVIKENFIPKTVAAIIMLALNMRSSDIHVEGSDRVLRIRYRVDGILRDIVRLPLKLHPPMISRIKILAKLKLDETRIPQDGRFSVKFKNHEVDVRTSSLPTVHGEKIVMRILDKEQTILSLEDLGMEGRAFDLTAEAVAKPYGVILSTGPTGSGKSTTLYAIISRVSVPSVNIVTLEDPVEYEIPGINQCQVKPGIGFTFAEGLRSVLRQDPNVVMVGEIRDSETANMATHAALTGHLVLSTLHTNDAAGALPRLINMGIEPFLITSSMNLVIAQRLIRRICPKCKREMKVPKSLVDDIQKELDSMPKNNEADGKRVSEEMKFFHGVGCSECTQGYKGRIGMFEVLRITDEIEDLAVKKMPANEIKKAAIKDGMITMRQDGILKAIAGITTIDEVFRATSE